MQLNSIRLDELKVKAFLATQTLRLYYRTFTEVIWPEAKVVQILQSNYTGTHSRSRAKLIVAIAKHMAVTTC